jgi:hypothetical protein
MREIVPPPLPTGRLVRGWRAVWEGARLPLGTVVFEIRRQLVALRGRDGGTFAAQHRDHLIRFEGDGQGQQVAHSCLTFTVAADRRSRPVLCPLLREHGSLARAARVRLRRRPHAHVAMPAPVLQLRSLLPPTSMCVRGGQPLRSQRSVSAAQVPFPFDSKRRHRHQPPSSRRRHVVDVVDRPVSAERERHERDSGVNVGFPELIRDARRSVNDSTALEMFD